MASSNKTSLGLTQYSLDDIPDMTDTNNDNVIITAELEKRPEADSDGKYPNAIQADTSGTADNANNVVDGGPLDVRLEAIEADVAQQAEELENFPTSGTAAMAKKLEMAREIGLTGAVTGSAEFDGSGNISIKTLPLYSLVGKSSGTTTPRWYKFASLKTSIPSNWDATIIFLVDAVFNAGNKIQGLLRAHVRKNNTDIDPGNMDISWIYAGTGINVEDYVMAYKLPNTVELWCKISALYRVVHFQVLATYDRHEILSNWWNLYETINDTNPTELPEGYTQIISTYSNLRTGNLISSGIEIPYDSNNFSKPIILHSDGQNIVRIRAAHKTLSDNSLTGIIKIESSGDNGITWVEDGFIIPANAFDTNPNALNILTMGNGDVRYLKNTGGTVTGNISIKSPNADSPNTPQLFFNTGTRSNARLFYHKENNRECFILQTIYNNILGNTILSGLKNPEIDTDAVPYGFLKTQLAALEAKLTGKTVAEVMAANAIPNEAPTLEAPEEEEITV